MEESEKEFRNRIKYENISIDKKIKNVYARKEAQLVEQKRKEEYVKAINKLQQQEER